MNFIHPDFLLHSEEAKKLYHDYAESLPIIDYHCHLSPKDVAENRRFQNMYEIWLEGDHYKWRAMRSNGVEEKFCTGDGEPYEKFLAFVNTMPKALRNPLYHWSHLELARYFDYYKLINEQNAREIWDLAESKLKEDTLSAHGILNSFKVKAVCTTDDPVDDLSYHLEIQKSQLKTKVFPTFRPDNALKINLPGWREWVARLENAAQMEIRNFNDFLDCLKQRHDFFHSAGGRLSDHGLPYCYAHPCSESEASAIFTNALAGKHATAEETEKFSSYMMYFFGLLDSEKNWTKQLHLGPLRSNNSAMLAKAGPDTGFDSIGDYPQAEMLSKYLDSLCRENALPKTILYNINPKDNYTLATMIGNFQDSSYPGKIQFGSGWWFLDQKEGMEWQINALSNLGLLSRFVGMLTDSRSFLSYPRHEYFRRILCNILGQDMQKGEIPNDMELVGKMVSDICYYNAESYFGLQLD